MARALDALRQDLGYALRQLWRNPGFAFVMVGTLGLGIGGVAAILSLVDAVILRPLPFREPQRLVLVWERNPARGSEHNVVGPYNLLRWRERNHSFESMAGFARFDFNVVAAGEPERVSAGIAVGDLFGVLGVAPRLGRALGEEDGRPGAPEAIVLAEPYWQRRFGGDPAVLGRTLEVNGRPRTIVGVMPARLHLGTEISLWIPVTLSEDLRNAKGRWATGVARLKPEVSLVQARDEMARLSEDLQRENPGFDTGWSADVRPLHADLIREARPALGLLLAAVSLVLLIACANVANLLLVRALAREREIAVRGALGAGAGRLIRQLLTEAALAAALGASLGLLIGRVALAAAVALLPPEIPLVVNVGLNGRVMLLTAAVAALSVLGFGLLPSLQLARRRPLEALRLGMAVRGTGGGHRRLSRLLVAGEIALSIVVLAGAGLLMRSFLRLSAVDPGFRTEGITAIQLNLSYDEPARVVAFYDDVLRRVRQAPGVRTAAAISWMPLGQGAATTFRALDRPEPRPGEEPVADIRIVTPGFFRTLATLREGRDFGPADGANAPKAVIVNEAAAKAMWSGRSPLGQRLSMSWGGEPVGEVVGVVGDVHFAALETSPRATLYWAEAQVPNSFMALMVGGETPGVAAAAVRQAVAAADPKVPLSRVRQLSEVVDTSLSSRRFVLLLTQAFAAVALGLAGLGTYGLIAHAVARRTPEIGVRMALGARGMDVARLILGESLGLGVAGIGAGLVAAAAGARVLRGLLFAISPWDPAAYVAVAVAGLVVVFVAAAIPARRAARLQPVAALREE